MTLQQIVEIFGDGQFKLCEGKRAIDSNLYGADQAQRWLEGGGTIGLWCPQGFVIVDIDDQQQAEIMCGLTDTLKCRTPHGMHFYFRTDSEIRQLVKAHTAIGLRIDTRTAGKGYCLLPYNCPDREWIDGDIEMLPDWIAPLGISAKAPEYIQVGAKDGDGRNDALIRQIMRIRKEGFPEERVRKAVQIINQKVWGERLSDGEIEGILDHAQAYTPFVQESGKPNFCLYNDKGSVCGINHKAIVDHLVQNCPMFTLGGSLYFYKDGVFQQNPLEVKAIIKELIAEPKYQRQGQINEIFNLLLDDLRIAITDSMCNQCRSLINFKNGMFDIETQRLYPHDPQYLSTIQIPHDYIPNDLAPEDIQLMDFLRQTKLPRDDVDMILDFIAYCMTTQNGMKCFMCLVGGSNTGKSTLIKMVTGLIGKHNMSALSIQDMSVRFYPAQLKDKLVNACADNSSEALNDIANLKKITGDDEIMYEDKGCKPFFFTPFSKLLFSFNTLPLQLEEKSDAFYERIRILEMNNKIVLTQTYVDDLCSPESISSIIPVLCRRLKGLKRIKPSANSKSLSDRLRSESDSIHSFLTTQVQHTEDYSDFISREDLYNAYARYCAQEDRPAHKRSMFFRQLEVIGLVPMKHKSQMVFVGIKKL